MTICVRILLLLPAVHHFTRSFIEKTVSRQLTGTLSIGRMSIDILGKIDLENVALIDSATGGDSLKLGHIRIRFSLPRLLGKEVLIKKISCDEASVAVIRTRSGSLRAPFLPRRTGDSEKSRRSSSWAFSVEAVDVSNLKAMYVDSLLSIETTLRDISCNGEMKRFDSLSGCLSIGKGRINTPWWRGTVSGISAGLSMGDNALTVDSLTISGDSVYVKGKGTIGLNREKPWNCEVYARTGRDALVILNQMKFISPGGMLTAWARWNGPIEQPVLSVDASAAGATVGRMYIDALRIKAEYDTAGDLNGAVHVVSAYGTGNATIGGRIPYLLLQPDLKRYFVGIRLEQARPRELSRCFNAKSEIPEALAELDLEAYGRSFSALPDSVSLQAVVRDKDRSDSGSAVIVAAHLRQRAWDVRLSDSGNNSLLANGKIGNRDSISGGFSFSIVQPTRISRFFLSEPVSGTIRGSGRLSGSIEKPFVQARLSVRDLDAAGFRATAVEATGSFHNDTLTWSDLKISSDSAAIASRGMAKLSLPRRFFEAAITAARTGCPDGAVKASMTLNGDSLAGIVSATSFSPALIEPWVNSMPPIAGELSLHSELGGSLKNPEAAFSFDFSQTLQRDRKIKYHGSMTLRDSTAKGSIRAFFGKARHPLDISLILPLSLKKNASIKEIVREGAVISARGDRIDAGDLLEAFIPSLRAEGTLTLAAEALRHKEQWGLSGHASVHLSSLMDSLNAVVIDTMHAKAAFAGSDERTSATLNIACLGAGWKGRRIGAFGGRCSYGDDTLFLDTFSSRLGDGEFRAAGVVPVAAFDTSEKNARARVRFSGSSIPLVLLGKLAPEVVAVGGTVSAAGELQIARRKPTVFGRVSITGALMRLFECDPAVGPVDADVVIAQDSFSITSLLGKLGKDGRFEGNGFATLGSNPHGRLGVSASDLRMQCADIDAGVQSLSVRLSDSSGAFVVSSDIDLAETRYTAFFSFADLIDQFDKRRPASMPAAEGNPLLDRVVLRGALNLRRNLTVETNVGRFVLDGKITAAGTIRKPGIVGTISVVEGFVYYLDRKFTIKKGTILLKDPEKITPFIDITATSRVLSFEHGGGVNFGEREYLVTLRVVGAIDKPDVTLSAEPSIKPVQIVSLLTLGTIQGNLGADILRRMEFILKQQVAGFGTRKLEKWLNIERIDIQPEGDRDAVVTAVKRVSPRLSVMYRTSIDDIENPQVKASYRLLPFLYFDGTGDYAGRAGADLRLRWSK